MNQALRKKLIRLAHANPALRADLLPLLTHKQAGGNATLVAMDKALRSAQRAVKKALKELEASPLAQDARGSVGPTAIRDLSALRDQLERLVGRNSPFIWSMVPLE
jgi:hypothetical protein